MQIRTCFIKSLKISNYRGFSQTFVPFNRNLSVFVAENGGGKTAILDAVAISLRLFVDTMEGKSTSPGFESGDIRLGLSPENLMEPLTPVRFDADAMILGEELSWSRERISRTPSSRTTTAEAQSLRSLANRLKTENEDWVERKSSQPPIFPLIASYGTGRLWNLGRLTELKKAKGEFRNSRYLGYMDCLSSASHYKIFADWFQRFSYAALAEEIVSNSIHEPKKMLEVIHQAVNVALEPSGWKDLRWDFVEETIVASHETLGQLSVDFLSDGIRTMIGLVADIAHRTARLNPHFGKDAATLTPGIVMIDEVDMHLHPEWQQVVLDSLQKAFPQVQFIVTTHSPQVVSTVASESIFILRDGKIHLAPSGTDGAEAKRMLEDVFGVESRPKTEMAQKLKRYMDLVQSGSWESAEAKALRIVLDEWSKGYEPSLLLADQRIENLKWEQEIEENEKGK